MRILIVDDTADSRHLISTLLARGGYNDVTAVGSAREAFSVLGIDPDRDDPQCNADLILMDLMMPEIDGIAACVTLKQHPRYRDTPVVMVTASPDLNSLEASFQAGATDFIRKPLHRMELLARVSSILALKEEMDRRKAREKELLEVRSQLEEANRRLAQQAILDPLTGIFNRRRFDETIETEWRRAIRDSHPLALILIDIDHFKAYNDTYGHQGGDDCLRNVAQALTGTISRPADLVARYGGEEFAAVLPLTQAGGAYFLAEKMRKAVAAMRIPHKGSTTAPHVTISVGVAAVTPSRHDQVSRLIEHTDQALYMAKEAGRNRVKLLPFPVPGEGA